MAKTASNDQPKVWWRKLDNPLVRLAVAMLLPFLILLVYFAPSRQFLSRDLWEQFDMVVYGFAVGVGFTMILHCKSSCFNRIVAILACALFVPYSLLWCLFIAHIAVTGDGP